MLETLVVIWFAIYTPYGAENAETKVVNVAHSYKQCITGFHKATCIPLKPCEYEDSPNCYWYDEKGNSFANVMETVMILDKERSSR